MVELGGSGSGDQYVSLDISRESENNYIKKLLRASEKIQSRAQEVNETMCSAIGGDKSKNQRASIMSEFVEFPIPKPLSSFEVKDLKNALMGEQEDHYFSEEALLGLPKPLMLAKQLKRLDLRQKFGFERGPLKILPFLPLLVKAEINPSLTAIEGILTWIVALSWAQVVIYGSTAVSFTGGIALFFALNILHYWYGFTRYHTLTGNWLDNMLTGKALDDSFEQTRDICSAYLHADSKRRNQTALILLTTPVTIYNHLSAKIVYGIMKCFMSAKGESKPPSVRISLNVGVYFTNVIVALIWLYGGPFWMTLAAINLWINQCLYSALLFRRSVGGFLSSFVLGNMLIVDSDKTQILEGLPVVASTDEMSTNSSLALYAINIQSNSIIESVKSSAVSLNVHGQSTTDSIFDGLESVAKSTASSLSLQQLPRLVTIKEQPASNSKALTIESSETHHLDPLQHFSPEITSSDVYVQKESHPGTIAWREIIVETAQKFDGVPFNEEQYLFVLKRLEGRNFYTEAANGNFERLDRASIFTICKEAYNRHLEVGAEVQDILEGLKDLQRSKHSASRSIKVPPDATKNGDGETETSSTRSTRDVILGENDNPGFQSFLKVISLAAEDNESEVYTEDVHDWVIPRVSAKKFFVSMESGNYRQATEDDILKFAEIHYTLAKERQAEEKLATCTEDSTIMSRSHYSSVEELKTKTASENNTLRESRHEQHSFEDEESGMTGPEQSHVENQSDENLATWIGEEIKKYRFDSEVLGNLWQRAEEIALQPVKTSRRSMDVEREPAHAERQEDALSFSLQSFDLRDDNAASEDFEDLEAGAPIHEILISLLETEFLNCQDACMIQDIEARDGENSVASDDERTRQKVPRETLLRFLQLKLDREMSFSNVCATSPHRRSRKPSMSEISIESGDTEADGTSEHVLEPRSKKSHKSSYVSFRTTRDSRDGRTKITFEV